MTEFDSVRLCELERDVDDLKRQLGELLSRLAWLLELSP